MQKYNEVDIFSTPRYERFFLFMQKLAQGKSHKERRKTLRSALNVPAKEKTLQEKKLNLLIGIRSEVNGFLQKIVTVNLSSDKVDLNEIVPERKYRYLLAKIFSENDIYESPKLESLVMKSFLELDAEYLANREDKTQGEFQDIVNLMQSIIDDLGKEMD